MAYSLLQRQSQRDSLLPLTIALHYQHPLND